MRLLAASALLLAVLLAGPGRTVLAQSPSPMPMADSFCPLSVIGTAFRKTSDGPEYVFKAYATLGGVAQGPGTIAIFAGDNRFDVTFDNAAYPVVVRLPSRLIPFHAYISQAGDRHCTPGFVWHNYAEEPLDLETANAEFKTLEAAVGSLKTIVPVLAAREPTPPCDHPNAGAKPLQPHPLHYPAAARGQEGSADIEVVVASDGTVYGTKVRKSSGNDLLDGAAVRAAELSTFTAERFRCQDVPGLYLFSAEFKMKNPPMNL